MAEKLYLTVGMPIDRLLRLQRARRYLLNLKLKHLLAFLRELVHALI